MLPVLVCTGLYLSVANTSTQAGHFMLFFGQIVKKASTATIYPHSEFKRSIGKSY